MNDNMISLVYVSLLAVYQTRGIVYAVAYGASQGMTTSEVMDILKHYEEQCKNAQQGLLP